MPTRRSEKRQPSTALGLQAQKPMSAGTQTGIRISAALVFVLAMSDFIFRHFVERHTSQHTVAGIAVEYGPFLLLVLLSVSLFAEPEKTARFILTTLDRVVGMIPGVGGKGRQNGG